MESEFDKETKQQLYSDIYGDSVWLINNAIAYTPAGSHIWVETKKSGDKSIVSVSDNKPHGTVFIFTLPAGKGQWYE